MRSLLSLLCLFTVGLCAAEPAQPDPVAMQEAMAKMSTIGDEHAALAKMVGTWKVKQTTWMAPGAAPEVAQGTATFTAVLGGKWFKQTYQGSMMGKSYNGLGFTGYDTFAKHYVATWCDDFSTAMTTMEGSSEDNGKTITFTASMPMCPMTGGPITFRHVQSWDANGSLHYTMYSTPEGGEEMKGMELVYTKTK